MKKTNVLEHDTLCVCTCLHIRTHHCANSSLALRLNFAPIEAWIYQYKVSEMAIHLQFQISTIFNVYMPRRDTNFAWRHFCSRCVRVWAEQEADKVISIGFGPGHQKGMSPWCVAGCSPQGQHLASPHISPHGKWQSRAGSAQPDEGAN